VATDRPTPPPRPAFYLETDFFSDVDDVGGLAIACARAAQGHIDLVGVGINTPSSWGAPAARAVADAYGVQPPIATLYPQDHSVFEKDYARALASMYPAVNPTEDFAGGSEGLWTALQSVADHSLGSSHERPPLTCRYPRSRITHRNRR